MNGRCLHGGKEVQGSGFEQTVWQHTTELVTPNMKAEHPEYYSCVKHGQMSYVQLCRVELGGMHHAEYTSQAARNSTYPCTA